jgi:catechol 2,3-dioxygenase-like lactoylglutathione lyase family enzyme
MGTILKSFNAVRIFVDDLDRARAFYRDVPELDEKSAEPGWVVFDIDGRDIILEALARDDAERALVGRLLAVSFYG